MVCVCVFTITFSSRTNAQFLLYGTGHEGGGDEQSSIVHVLVHAALSRPPHKMMTIRHLSCVYI